MDGENESSSSSSWCKVNCGCLLADEFVVLLLIVACWKSPAIFIIIFFSLSLETSRHTVFNHRRLKKKERVFQKTLQGSFHPPDSFTQDVVFGDDDLEISADETREFQVWATIKRGRIELSLYLKFSIWRRFSHCRSDKDVSIGIHWQVRVWFFFFIENAFVCFPPAVFSLFMHGIENSWRSRIGV